MPSRPRTATKQRRFSARVVLAVSGLLGVVGSLMTVGLSSAAAVQLIAGSAPEVSTTATSPATADIGILWAWTLTPSDPVTPIAPPTTAPTTTAPPTTAPPTTAPPVSAGINSLNRILYSMSGPHEGAPHGVPSYWSWGQVPSLQGATPPAGMSAITGWGQIYSDASNTQPANVRVELRNMETYVWSKSGRAWIRVQGTTPIDGAHYVENFAGNASIPTDLRAELDGGTSTGMMPGFNFHFWPRSGRGSLSNPADVGAVYTTVQARLILDNPNGPDNRSQARYLANTGADWWRTPTATFGDGTNNPGVGQSRFTYLSSNWTAVNFYTGGPIASAPGSWTEAQLGANPPPVNAMG